MFPFLYFVPFILCLAFLAYFYVEDSKLRGLNVDTPRSDLMVPVMLVLSAVPGFNIVLLILLLFVAFLPM
jgi:hypothetical protein